MSQASKINFNLIADPSLAFQFRACSDGESEMLEWTAESFYVVEAEADRHAKWFIYCNRYGKFTIDVSDMDLVDYKYNDGSKVDLPEYFDTLAEAKSHCEELEYDLQCHLESQGFIVVPALRERERRNSRIENAI